MKKKDIRDELSRRAQAIVGPIHKGLQMRAVSHPVSSCLRKTPYTLNQAIARASDLHIQDGDPFIGLYFCLWCYYFHVGHYAGPSSYKRQKIYCVWCGNMIRKTRLTKHITKCGRAWIADSEEKGLTS